MLEGEDASAYQTLENRIYSAVKPEDAIEEMWVLDILDLVWEIKRLRRLKAKLMHAAAHEGLYTLLRPLVHDGPFYERDASLDELIRGWALRDPEALKEVNQILGHAGLDGGSIVAQTLVKKLDTFEKIDRMIMQTEARRDVVLREIDRRRDALAQRLREFSTQVEDGEFAVIGPPVRGAAE